MHLGRQHTRDAFGIRILDDFAAIGDAGDTLQEQALRAFEDFSVAHTATSAHEHRDAGSGLDDFAVDV